MFFHTIVAFSSLDAMSPFPGVPPFRLETEKWMNSGQLSRYCISFIDQTGQRYFLKFRGKLSEFFYQYCARKLGVSCQQSWPWSAEDANALDSERKLGDSSMRFNAYVIKYEPHSVQSSFVLGGDPINCHFRRRKAEFNYRKIIEECKEVKCITMLMKLEQRARRELDRCQRSSKEPFADIAENLRDAESCTFSYPDYPILHTLQGEPVGGAQLSASGTTFSGVRSWLMKIAEHKKKFLTQLDQPLDFDSESLIKIQVLNHILGMDDRTWHNLLYNYETKSFVAIDNENVGRLSFPNWYENKSFWYDKCRGFDYTQLKSDPNRPRNEDVVLPADEEQKRMFRLYKKGLEQFLVLYPTPEAVIESFNRQFPDYDANDFLPHLEQTYPRIVYTLGQIEADLQDAFIPKNYPVYEEIEAKRKFQELQAIAPLAAEETENRQEIITQEENARVALQRQFKTDGPITIAQSEPVRRNMPPWRFKRVGNRSLGVAAAVGLLLTIDSIKRKGLHPYLKDLGRYRSLLSRKLPKKIPRWGF